MSFDLKTAIGSIAPTLATMLGGPLAGMATTAICSAFGISPTSSSDDITRAVQTGMTPETIAAVRAADQKHAEIITQQGIDLQKLNADHEAAMAGVDAGDRDSARKRETAVGDRTNRILAYTVVSGFLAMVAATLLGYAKVESVLAGTLVGYLSAKCEQVLAYYFGSSAGSARKDGVIAAQASNAK